MIRPAPEMASKDGGKGRRPLALVGPDPEVLFYARQAEEKGGPVLVLGCAHGRVAWGLAERRLAVVGVDPSEVMIALAEERRAGEGPEAAARARFLVADPRSLRLDERFPTVLAPQHALGLMQSTEDLEAFLATVRHHLAPGGTFAFDVHNPRRPPRPEHDGPTSPLEPRRPLFSFHLRERRVRKDAPEGIRRLRLKHFGPEELEAALARAGLVLRERYGGFDGKPFDPEDPRQIGVAGP